MEYVCKIDSFGLQMMLKSDLEKLFLNCLHTQNLFHLIYGRIFALNYKFSNKNDLVCAWRDYKKILVVYIFMML